MFVTNLSIAFLEEQKWSDTGRHCGHAVHLCLKKFHEHFIPIVSLKLGARLYSKSTTGNLAERGQKRCD